MRYFTNEDNNFNWAAIGGICAVIGTLIASITFFRSSNAPEPASVVNTSVVLEDYVAGDKIEGITLEQYEEGLFRKETEVIARLKEAELPSEEAVELRKALLQIDARQAELQKSYKGVAELTAGIRRYHENSADPSKVREAIDKLFEGDTAAAARLSIKAGIPVNTVGTIESLTSVFQPIETKTDFLRYVAGKALNNNDDYTTKIAKDGRLSGHFSTYTGVDRLSGSWAWINGQYCRAFQYKDKAYSEHCANVFATTTAVKFVESNGQSKIWAIK